MIKGNIYTIFFLFFYFSYAQKQDTIRSIATIRNDIDVQEFKISEELVYSYEKPKFLDFIMKLPTSFVLMGNMFIQKNNLIWFGASVGATAALMPFDQKIIDNSRKFGDRIGFKPDHTYSGPLKIAPKDINSAIYRVGNGFSVLLIGGVLLTYGLIHDNYRAIHTSSELAEGLIATGILVQCLKRITGRESPFIAEQNGNSGGNWTWFPSFSAYQRYTSNYDAMPSGHLATLMTSVMVIAENYKEIRWIKPVGFGVMGLMMFEMVQSKVHWTSDYPLAIFMGYIIGKSIVKNRITEKKETKIGDKNSFHPKFNYSFSSDRNYTLVGIRMQF